MYAYMKFFMNVSTQVCKYICIHISMELLYTSYLLIDIDFLGMQQCYDRSTLVVKAYLQAFVKDIG